MTYRVGKTCTCTVLGHARKGGGVNTLNRISTHPHSPMDNESPTSIDTHIYFVQDEHSQLDFIVLTH